MSAPDRRAKLDWDHPTPSLRRQCALLGVARSGVYRQRRAANDDDLALMRRIDEMFLRWPFLGSRRMVAMLAAEGIRVNRKRVRRLMGIVPLGPKQRTSKPGAGHKIYPYLLRGLVIDRPNQVWCADITYLPIGRDQDLDGREGPVDGQCLHRAALAVAEIRGRLYQELR